MVTCISGPVYLRHAPLPQFTTKIAAFYIPILLPNVAFSSKPMPPGVGLEFYLELASFTQPKKLTIDDGD
ncbi:MAG: hypothetical protein D6816_12285 [Bacteroidetes bacterium]|nr:MAG: hypothetical protein D6816_12285 [Bacteroidota bacterium]